MSSPVYYTVASPLLPTHTSAPVPATHPQAHHGGADMSKQPIRTVVPKDGLDGYGPFDESYTSLQVGPSRCRSSAFVSRINKAFSVAWKGLVVFLLALIAMSMLRGVREIIGAGRGQPHGPHHGTFGGEGPCSMHRHGKFPEWHRQAKFIPAVYQDYARERSGNSSSATFELGMHKWTSLVVPASIEGEVVFSYLDVRDQSEAKVVIETFWKGEGVEGKTQAMGFWSAPRTDELCIDDSHLPAAYHRIHIYLPAMSRVPSLASSLPLRTYTSPCLADFLFTSLDLISNKEGQDITGYFNVSHSISLIATSGHIDVDVWVVPARVTGDQSADKHKHHSKHPKDQVRIEAISKQGDIDLRVSTDRAPNSTVRVEAVADEGNVMVIDPTFLGKFELVLRDGESVIDVQDEENKKVWIENQIAGMKEGYVMLKHKGGEGEGRAESRVGVVARKGDVVLHF